MGATTLVGRASELAAMQGGLRRLALGEGGVLLMEGEPGIGKTRLVEEALAEAEARGLQRFHGSCGELEGELPFAPLIAALELTAGEPEPERAALVELVAGTPRGSGRDGERVLRSLHGLAGLVERICDRGPALLAVDDLQWADRPTLMLLDRLVRRSPHLPLLLLLTLRPFPASPPLEALRASVEDATPGHRVLGPLDEAEVAQLTAEAVGAEPGEELLRAVRGAAGNPLFVGEVLTALEREDALVRRNGVVDAARFEVAPSVRVAILRRLRFLPEPCLDVLRLAAVLGSEFDVQELSVVAGRPAAELVAVLADAVDSGVLREAGTRLSFAHDLVREALYNDRPLAMREALHHSAARSLREAGYSPLKVATHLLRGNDGPDREAIGLLRETAQQCAYRDPTVAVQLFERALALAPATDGLAVDIKGELASALFWAGRWTDGEQIARELESSDLAHEPSGEVLVALVHAAYVRGEVPTRLAEQVARAARAPGLPAFERARLLVVAAQADFLRGDLGAAAEHAERAAEAARGGANRVALAEALLVVSAVRWHEARAAEGAEAAEHALAVMRDLPGDLAGDAQMPHVNLAMCLGLLQRPEEAFAALQEGRVQAERANNVWTLAMVHQMVAVSQFLAGLFDAAEGEFEAALSLWEEMDARLWGIVQQAWLSRLAVHRGDLATARAHLARANEDLPRGAPWSPARNVAVVALARALILEAEGDAAAAFEELDHARAEVIDAGALIFTLRIGPDHVRLALAVARPDAALAMTEATEEAAARIGSPVARAQALRCRGLLERDASLLLESVEAHRGGPSRVELAGAAEDAAAALLARDGEDAAGEAVGLLRDGLEVWEAAGAVRDAARVEARLRALGERPGKRGPRRREERGWAALTASERRVVDLVREGLAYREVGERLFISRRTVEWHVARAFSKLGVRSRAELAALPPEVP